MQKVLWLTNNPSPYRVDFFNELGQYCDLTVVFEKPKSVGRDASWLNCNAERFKPVFLTKKTDASDNILCFGVEKYLKKKNGYDHIIVSNFADLTGIWAICHLKMRGLSYEIESDGGFAGSGKGFKEGVKKWLFKKAVRCFSTAEEHDKYYKTYGVPEEKLVRYPFTSLYEKDIIEKPISIEEKKILREKLGIPETKVVLSVGRFVHSKGFDILLQAMALLPRDIGLYIIGGTPTEDYLNVQKEYRLTNVHFIDFKLKAELCEWYLSADCFALPTRSDVWGLVVNEAMACGLPVVVTDKCIAGLELVKNGVNGHIVPVDNVEALADGIQQCLDNKETYSVATLERIQDYTIEKMVEAHLKEWQI